MQEGPPRVLGSSRNTYRGEMVGFVASDATRGSLSQEELCSSMMSAEQLDLARYAGAEIFHIS